jgi:cytochrome c oxidase assembly protein subunit 15
MLAQVTMGILALLTFVHLHVALTHHALAIVVLGFAAAHWRGTRGSYPLETRIVEAA